MGVFIFWREERLKNPDHKMANRKRKQKNAEHTGRNLALCWDDPSYLAAKLAGPFCVWALQSRFFASRTPPILQSD